VVGNDNIILLMYIHLFSFIYIRNRKHLTAFTHFSKVFCKCKSLRTTEVNIIFSRISLWAEYAQHPVLSQTTVLCPEMLSSEYSPHHSHSRDVLMICTTIYGLHPWIRDETAASSLVCGCTPVVMLYGFTQRLL